MIELEQQGDVWVLSMRDGENRFNLESIAALHAALDRVEQVEGPVALVTTGEGKFYSNGLDLDWLLSAGPEAAGFIDDVHRLLGRVLGFAGATVAAVNGHAFAGGGMLACAHDAIVMREDRGYWCLPEVDLGLPFSTGMNALLVAKLPRRTAHEAMTTGRRYTAPEAEAAGILDGTAAEEAVVSAAVERAAAFAGKAGPALGEIKSRLYADAVRALAE
jgi:enoyl-CoA hydratase/carnithine racemase